MSDCEFWVGVAGAKGVSGYLDGTLFTAAEAPLTSLRYQSVQKTPLCFPFETSDAHRHHHCR
jgi:hypothetical protein